MITIRETCFRLDTEHTSYMFQKTKFGHLEHVYYGKLLDDEDSSEILVQKRSIQVGSSVFYDRDDNVYALDRMCLEWSDNGRGDFRQSPSEFMMPDGSFVTDFIYDSHVVVDENIPMNTLPTAYGADHTLIISLKDKAYPIYIDLYYSLYEQTDVITRRAVVRNESNYQIKIKRFMSMSLDMLDESFHMYTLDGGWIKEANLHKHSIFYGITINSSTTGASSNRHNPAFLLAEADANEDYGSVYAFNMIYSGNHYSIVEKNERDYVRISIGINPHCFEWEVSQGEMFESPECVMSYSSYGFNGASHHMHDFINEHIIRGDYKKKERPVLLNNWEAHFFDFKTPEQRKDIADQIAFYKQYRSIFQYGRFYRIKTYKQNKVFWETLSEDKSTALTGLFQILSTAAEGSDKLKVIGLKKGRYTVRTRSQRLYIDRFGGLTKHILPVELNPDGMILRVANRLYTLRDCVETYSCSEKALESGIPLCDQFIGTGYQDKVRMLGDFGSNMYIISREGSELT